MIRYGMVIEISKCAGCYNCFLACKDEHCGHDFPGYSAPQPMTGHAWMRLIETERGSYPKVKVAYTAVPCMHCQEAPCIEHAEDGAVYRRPDGIVVIDPIKAKGQKQLVASCPYRCIYWNEKLELPQKCSFCAHLLDAGWKEPRCVELCPAGALTFGDLDDPQSEVSQLMATNSAEVLHPEFGLRENILYLNLPKRFVAGCVVLGDSDQCGRDVTVTLSGDEERRELSTDGFGDFEFEGLEKDQEYTLTFSRPGYETREVNVFTRIDSNIGEIVLAKL
jgi:Fe-S-cluster-containing dehydrogenase component